MRRRFSRRTLVAASLLVGVAAALAAVSALALRASTPRPVQPAGEAEFPSALGRHVDALKEAIPGNGGEPADAASAEGMEFAAQASPDDDVPLARIETERAA